ncbi:MULTISPECIES: GIY-YIG nuclease family protein [Pseudoalteromonas]|uniref:GIY-YIG nuclease family protein n=1 Tax=Pseudoalteromonas viridis TaxID=339617 RepID=A0ABX7VE02_9GAMM|nr:MULTISPECIES: GIY-YIG nuclease family protein [Pseudoalteromonas]MCG7534099.1 GIY-YIG nuclease family protein [Pseudoalteromonas sp. OOF1S-7]QTL38176.1 GIY-YIG nuclease family protein [Pseudoalteromonas viridis]
MQAYVYIMASAPYGTLYVGVTTHLKKRVWQHKTKVDSTCFTAKYEVFNLVYFEISQSIQSAIKREKQLKRWRRSWKIELIEKVNLDWRDMYYSI